MDVVLDGVGVRIAAAQIVTDVTLRCAPGAVVGLIGPNGSGKSTVLKTIYHALRPTTGAVLLDGRDAVHDLGVRETARRVAALGQHHADGFDLDVAEIVMTGRTPHQRAWSTTSRTDREAVAAALGVVGLHDHAARAFSTLSGGERQRVLLARALAQQPRVLVLDEPTNHLDVATQLALLDLAGSLGLTVLAALHDLNLAAAYCDHLAVLHDGAVVASGTPEDVLHPELVADVFGVHAHRSTHPVTGRVHLALSRLPA